MFSRVVSLKPSISPTGVRKLAGKLKKSTPLRYEWSGYSCNSNLITQSSHPERKRKNMGETTPEKCVSPAPPPPLLIGPVGPRWRTSQLHTVAVLFSVAMIRRLGADTSRSKASEIKKKQNIRTGSALTPEPCTCPCGALNYSLSSCSVLVLRLFLPPAQVFHLTGRRQVTCDCLSPF